MDGYTESWVGLVFLDAAYWKLNQKEEEEVLERADQQAKWAESLWKGRYRSSQRRCLRSS